MSVWLKPFDQAEPFAKEEHVWRKDDATLEVTLMRRSPVCERSVALPFVERESRINFVKPLLDQFLRFENRPRDARSIKHHHALARACGWSITNGPAGRSLRAYKDQVGEFVR